MIKLKRRLIGVWVGFQCIQLTATGQAAYLAEGRELREVLGQVALFDLGGAGQESGGRLRGRTGTSLQMGLGPEPFS